MDLDAEVGETSASSGERFVDDDARRRHEASRGAGHVDEGERGAPARQHVVDDDDAFRRREHHRVDGEHGIDAAGRGGDGARQCAGWRTVVLLGIDERDAGRDGCGGGDGDPGGFGGEDEPRLVPSHPVPEGRPDPAKEFWFHTVIQEGVDADEAPIERRPASDLFSQLHHVTVPSAVMASPIPDPSTEERRNASVILRRLHKRYPEMATALDYDDAWQLLVATVLSAQTTDETVNRVVPDLFARYPTPADLAGANPEDVEQIIFSTGFYRQKTKSVIALAGDLVDRYGGEVPRDLNELVTLRGVGRKTASVVLAEVWDMPAIAVDTHVKRVTNRLGLTHSDDPVKIEHELRALYRKDRWSGISMRFIQFGRDVCDARRPRCWECPLADRCPYEPKSTPE